MDHPSIVIKRCEDFDALNKWASEFGHSVSGNWPTFEVWKGEKRLAYFELPTIPVIYPGISPDCSKREVLQCCHSVVDRLKSSFGACQAVTPKDTDFSPEIMAHFGFNPDYKKLFTITDHGKLRA